MLITCPNCLTQFSVDDKILTSNSQNFKCSECQHHWKQYIEKKEENAVVLQNLPLAHEEELFPQLTPSKSFYKKHVVGSMEIPEEFKPLSKKKSWTFFSFLVALFLFLCFISGLDKIFKHNSDSLSSSGLHLQLLQIHNVQDNFRILEDGKIQIIVQGEIINNSTESLSIPPIYVDIKGPTGKILETHEINKNILLKKGEHVTFFEEILSHQSLPLITYVHF